MSSCFVFQKQKSPPSRSFALLFHPRSFWANFFSLFQPRTHTSWLDVLCAITSTGSTSLNQRKLLLLLLLLLMLLPLLLLLLLLLLLILLLILLLLRLPLREEIGIKNYLWDKNLHLHTEFPKNSPTNVPKSLANPHIFRQISHVSDSCSKNFLLGEQQHQQHTQRIINHVVWWRWDSSPHWGRGSSICGDCSFGNKGSFFFFCGFHHLVG